MDTGAWWVMVRRGHGLAGIVCVGGGGVHCGGSFVACLVARGCCVVGACEGRCQWCARHCCVAGCRGLRVGLVAGEGEAMLFLSAGLGLGCCVLVGGPSRQWIHARLVPPPGPGGHTHTAVCYESAGVPVPACFKFPELIGTSMVEPVTVTPSARRRGSVPGTAAVSSSLICCDGFVYLLGNTRSV